MEQKENEIIMTDQIEQPKKKKKKKKKGLIIAIVVACVVMIVIAGKVISNMSKQMESQIEEMSDQMEDGTEKVERQDIRQEIVSSGVVVGIDKKAYTSPVTAKVKEIRVEPGQTVKKGDVLLTYDATDLGDDLEKVKIQAQSERAAGNESYEQAGKAAGKVSNAKAKIKSLNSDIKKLKKEIEKLTGQAEAYEEKMNATEDVQASDDTGEETEGEGVEGTENATQNVAGLSAAEKKKYKKITSDLKKKNESLANKQAELAEQESIVAANEDITVSESTKAQISATNQLSDMNINDAQESYDAAEAGITAAADGIIESVDVVEGAFASETQTLLTVIDSKKIGVEFSVSKNDLGSIATGQKARVVISGQEYEGTIDFVSRVAVVDEQLASSSATATIKGRIAIENPDDNIYIGVSAKVYIFAGESLQTLAVPYEALNTDVDGDFVYIVNKENLIERKDVTIGIFSDEYYEITEGISEGDRVITSVTKDMKPGDEYVPSTTPMMTGF